MNENARRKRVLEDRGRRAAAALGYSYDESQGGTAPTSVATMPAYSGVPLPGNILQPGGLKDEVLHLLVDILHLADHEGQPLDLASIIKEASALHAQEKGAGAS